MRAKFAETESPSICAALPRMADPAPLAASVTRRKKANSTDRRAGSRDNVSTERADSTEFKWAWGVGKLSVMNEANAERRIYHVYFPFPLLLTQYGAKAPTQEERRPPRSLGSMKTDVVDRGVLMNAGRRDRKRWTVRWRSKDEPYRGDRAFKRKRGFVRKPGTVLVHHGAVPPYRTRSYALGSPRSRPRERMSLKTQILGW